MENKFNTTNLSSSRSENILKKYHQITSPLVSMQSAKKQDFMKEEMRQNVGMKLDCIKNRSSKIYALDTTISYSDLKAGATLYQIPQFSVPEVNFEVSDQIRKKVQEAKKEIITYFPQISKSSNYAPKKIEHQLNHRSAVRQLEEWLNQKLKNPPTNSQESIEYKNMIMGIGMKQLIRIIGKRCNQQGRMAEQIWELTWSICRQIILYLSKRAKKCQQILQEELLFMRTSYQKEFQRLNSQNTQFSKTIQNLEEQNKEYLSQLVKIRKRRLNLQQENKSISYQNGHLQNELKKVLQENLAIYLQIGDKNKRGWIKKMYKDINSLPAQVQQTVTAIFKKEVAQVIEERVKLQEITGECEDKIEIQEIQKIGNQVNKRNRNRNKNKQRKSSKLNNGNQSTLITVPFQQIDQIQSQDSEKSCVNFVRNMRDTFLPIDAQTQTQKKLMIQAYASTYNPTLCDASNLVTTQILGLLQEIGVNTDQVKEESKTVKKKGKENAKDQSKSKQKQKTSNAPLLKSKTKLQKSKKINLDPVQQYRLQESKVEQKNDNYPLVTEILNNVENNSLATDTKSDSNNKSIHKDGNNHSQTLEGITKTNSTIISPTLAAEIRQKSAISANQGSINKQNNQNGFKKKNQLTQPSTLQLPKSEYQQIAAQYKLKENRMSIEESTKVIQELKERQNKVESINECKTYICAQCNKIISSMQQKFLKRKNKFNEPDKGNIFSSEQRRSHKASPYQSIKRFNPDQQLQAYSHFEKRSSVVNILRRQGRKNSSYIHDISFKKDMEQQQQNLKTPYYNNSKDQTYQKGQEQDIQICTSAYNKLSPYLLLFTQLIEGNRSHIQTFSNAAMPVDLQNYFQIVRQVNSIPENKINMTEKSAISIIEKNIFPILNQLLNIVKKAVKLNKISETIKNFTSLPNIIYNRISRKYGVKILAIKNLKILLMGLKDAGKYTEKYKIIELMMFTDCKSPHSQDLFMYLFIMAMFDPTFSPNKLIILDEIQKIRKVCEDHLSKQPLIYQQVDKIMKQAYNKEQGTQLLSLVKSIITNYRLLKISRIQQMGFIYLMLKKNHYMSYKKFIYFLSTLNITHSTKLKISKKLLQFCDVKNKEQTIGISELMFSKFLMSCEDFNFKFLENITNLQLQTYKASDKDIVDHLSCKFFISQKYIQTKYEFQSSKNEENRIEIPRESISIEEFEGGIPTKNKNNDSSLLQLQEPQKAIENITVLKKIKEYSSFTLSICQYLQNRQQTKYLTFNQHLFIKNYLIIHIIESQIEETMGLVDYFSNSMLDIICMPQQQFSINFNRQL